MRFTGELVAPRGKSNRAETGALYRLGARSDGTLSSRHAVFCAINGPNEESVRYSLTKRRYVFLFIYLAPRRATLLSAFDRYLELQQYVSWTADDAVRVRAVSPLVSPHFERLVDDFYAEIEHHSNARKAITGGDEQVARLKTTLVRWLSELFSGTYDREYVERRSRVGLRHVEIGLDQVYVNAALSRLRRGLLNAIAASWTGEVTELDATRTSLNTLIDLDLAIIEDAYQSEFQRRQALAERLATIGKVAGGVAHELRNPLNVVKTSVYYIQNAKNPPPEKIQTHLNRIEHHVGIADRVISALTDFARMPAPQVEPVDLRECLGAVLAATSLPANIDVAWSVESPSPQALGDPAQLQIVFANLVRNARDAMTQGGKLTLSVGRQGEFVETTVADTGEGIPRENLARILEPLYSTKAKGIGLGLSLAKEIVARHNGELLVESELGAGASFTVRLPGAD
jgi:two-component system NtrC family sensor kinase